jgi:hypothetical protein
VYSDDFVRQTSLRSGWATAAEMYYDVFLPNQSGVICAGAAVFYDRVLKLFGVNSFTVSFGQADSGLTHVTVVVPELVAGQWKYYILDPTFNISFTDATTNQYLSYFDLIDYLAAGNIGNIVTVSRSIASRNWIADAPGPLPGTIFQTYFGDYLEYSYPTYGLNQYLADNQAAFISHGFPTGLAGFITMMQTHVFGIGPSLDSGASQQFLAQLQTRGISYG